MKKYIITNLQKGAVNITADQVLEFDTDQDLTPYAINTDLGTEVTNRQNADTAETNARIAADSTLQTNIDAEVVNRQNAVTNETNARITGDSNTILTLKDGVDITGDSLQKLYNLIQLRAIQRNVLTIAERNALNISIGAYVFVEDDGDGRWAQYRATSAGINATYIKVSDPDLLNAVMTNAQIRAAYLSNAGTEEFTTILLTKLNSIASGATVNQTDTYLLSLANATGSLTSSQISDFATSVDARITGKENTITPGTTSQYYRGDKTFQTLDKTVVGLSNVDNTSDVNKPISIPTQTALNLKSGIFTTLSGYGITNGIDNSTNQTVGGTKTLNETLVSNATEITVANKGKFVIPLKFNTETLVVKQTYYWSGSAYVANQGYGIGIGALASNMGANANGFGYFALAYNTGSNCSGFGNSSLQYNTGINSNGVGPNSLQYNIGSYVNGFGNGSLQFNTGVNTNGFGYFSLQSNTGSSVNGVGYLTLRYNGGSGNNVFGFNSYSTFLTNTAGAKIVTSNSTNIVTATSRITIPSHGFGTSGTSANLTYSTDGVVIGGLSNGSIYLIDIIDANTIYFRLSTLTTTGGTANHTFTPQYAYSNVNILGNNIVPTRSDQTIITGKSLVMPNSLNTEIDSVGGKALISLEYLQARIPTTQLLTSTQMAAISPKTIGMLIYQTDAPIGLKVWNGTAWV